VSVWTPTTHADLLSCRGCALVAPTVDLPNPPVPARCDVCGGTMTSSKRILAERVGCVLVVWTECVTCLGAEPVCLEPGEDPR
jgi:hypothetical protein